MVSPATRFCLFVVIAACFHHRIAFCALHFAHRVAHRIAFRRTTLLAKQKLPPPKNNTSAGKRRREPQ
jgi:hypothetical protein